MTRRIKRDCTQKRIPLPDIDIQNDVNTRARYARQRVDDMRNRIASYELDPQGARRVLECQCRSCFYLRGAGAAGQAFTSRPCDLCAEIVTYSSTHTQRYCEACAKTHDLCRECGGPMDMMPRLELAVPARKALVGAWWQEQTQLREEREKKLQEAHTKMREDRSVWRDSSEENP